jgi:hypothetical protein
LIWVDYSPGERPPKRPRIDVIQPALDIALPEQALPAVTVHQEILQNEMHEQPEKRAAYRKRLVGFVIFVCFLLPLPLRP